MCVRVTRRSVRSSAKRLSSADSSNGGDRAITGPLQRGGREAPPRESPPDGLVGSRPGRHRVNLDAWPISCEGGQLASESSRLRDAEVRVDRSAISPTLNKHQTVSVVDMVVDIVTDASSFAT